MTGKTVPGLVVLLAFSLPPFSLAPVKDKKKSNAKTQRRPFNENRFPIADYSAAEPKDPVQSVPNVKLEGKSMTNHLGGSIRCTTYLSRIPTVTAMKRPF